MSLLQRVTSIDGIDLETSSVHQKDQNQRYGTVRSLRTVISYDILPQPEEDSFATHPTGGVAAYKVSEVQRLGMSHPTTPFHSLHLSIPTSRTYTSILPSSLHKRTLTKERHKFPASSTNISTNHRWSSSTYQISVYINVPVSWLMVISNCSSGDHNNPILLAGLWNRIRFRSFETRARRPRRISRALLSRRIGFGC